MYFNLAVWISFSIRLLSQTYFYSQVLRTESATEWSLP